MLLRRHLFFCLIALAALAGCKTKTTRTPDTAVAGTGQDHGSSSARQGARDGEQNAATAAESKASAQAAPADANPANIPESVGGSTSMRTASASPGAPAASPPPPDVPPRDTRSPSDTSAKAVAKMKTVSKEKPSPLDSHPSPPATPPKTARLTVAAVTPPTTEPAPAGRVSITVPPVAPTAPRPVARLTIGEQALPPASPKITPRPISLPSLVTAAPTTAPVQRLTTGIAVSSLSELQPARPQSQSIDLFARLASPQVAAGSQDQAQTLRLPLAIGTAPISARFDQPLMVPLPDTVPVLWQTKGVPAVSVSVLSNWLSSPPPPPPPDSPAAREDRESLHRKIYQILLGHQ